MQDKGLVSVVTATYNMGQYAALAVKSVLCQTYPHVESIVVDDGSTDGTPETMEQFRTDPRVKFIRLLKNQGQTVAKNTGLREAKGKYLAFVDADNLWMPDKLEKQLPLFDQSEKIGVVYSDLQLIDGEGKKLPSIHRTYHQGCITAPLLVHNFVNFNSAVVKRECLERIGRFDESLSMGIDWDLWLRISIGYKFAFLPEPTYSYRIWPNQMSHNTLKRLECAKKILDKFFNDNPGKVSGMVKRKAWASLHRGYGAAYAEKGKLSEALHSYGRAIMSHPMQILTWKGIAKLFLKKQFPGRG